MANRFSVLDMREGSSLSNQSELIELIEFVARHFGSLWLDGDE